jgi:hypothetical protein
MASITIYNSENNLNGWLGVLLSSTACIIGGKKPKYKI